jgi:hypothetical protein
LISLDFQVLGFHAFDMKILLMAVTVQSLNLLAFTWFNREAWIRILALRQQLNIYKRRHDRPSFGPGRHPFRGRGIRSRQASTVDLESISPASAESQGIRSFRRRIVP